MYNIGVDGAKFGETTNILDAVSVTLLSTVHVNDLVTAANAIVTGEFVMHMSNKALSEPAKFGHMYEWGMVGDPNGRLWKHILRGSGANRQLSFTFKASVKTVPVAPRLADLGVKRNHIFTMKASVMELGLPVSISPVIAKMLVFESKGIGAGAGNGNGYVRDGIVFHNGPIVIAKQGNSDTWGSFTTEFGQWFRSGMPEEILNQTLYKITTGTIRSLISSKLAKLRITKAKPKTFTLTPAGVDKSFQQILTNSLRANYIGGAASRRAMMVGDEQ